MKRKLLVLMATMMAAVSPAWAYVAETTTAKIGDIYYNLYSDGHAEVGSNTPYQNSDGYNYSGESLVIPESVKYANETYSVTAIADNAFQNCTTLTEVRIPKTVKEFGDNVFAGCEKLNSVILLSTTPATTVSQSTFTNTSSSDMKVYVRYSSLANYTSASNWQGISLTGLPYIKYTSKGNVVLEPTKGVVFDAEYLGSTNVDGVGYLEFVGVPTKIPNSMFVQKDALTSITIPEQITRIGNFAFRWCDNLETVEYESNEKLTEIGKEAFSGSGKISSTQIPNSVTTIEDFAFFDCWGLTSIHVPTNVTSIGKGAFRIETSSPYDVETITFDGTLEQWCAIDFGNELSNPMSCKTAGQGTVLNSNGEPLFETTLEIPASITEVKPYTFYNANITELNLGNVTKVGAKSFKGCSALATLTLNADLQTMGTDALDLSNITTLNYNIPNAATLTVKPYDATKLTTVNIGENVQTIPESAFAGSQITSVEIPASVTAIGADAFDGCTMTGVTYGGDIDGWCNITFDNEKANPLSCSDDLLDLKINNEKVSEVEISVSEVKPYAFINSSITSLNLGSVTSIGDGSFKGCSSLTTINVGKTPPTLGTSSFSGISSEHVVNVPISAYTTYKATAWKDLNLKPIASQPHGSGTSADPYLVSTADELFWISTKVNDGTLVNSYNELTADIDLAGIENWEPIGTETRPFTGTFDGQGHTISNMKIEVTSNYTGLFGCAGNSGLNQLYCNIKNLSISGTITSNNAYEYIGGLVGYAKGKSSGECNIIENCHSSVNISSEANLQKVAGIAGRADQFTEIHRCSYTGDIYLPNATDQVAGITGYIYSYNCVIADCLFNGKITKNSSVNMVGGILGYVNQSGKSTKVYNNLSLGTITPAGGMIIGNAKNTNGYSGDATIKNNYAPKGTTLYGGTAASTCKGENVSTAQLLSGEVCWKLNESSASGAWKQNLGDEGDANPVLDQTHATVYHNETQTVDAPAQNAQLLSFCSHIDGTISGATVYEFAGIHDTYVYGEPVEDGAIEAGKPYILMLDEVGSNYTFTAGYTNTWVTEGLEGDYGIKAVLEDDCGEGQNYLTVNYDVMNALVFSQNKILRAKTVSNGGTKIGAGKCYINANKAFITNTNKAPARIAVFIDNEATGIEEITTTQPAANSAYTLQGIRVGADYKGFVIENGKKVIRK